MGFGAISLSILKVYLRCLVNLSSWFKGRSGQEEKLLERMEALGKVGVWGEFGVL